MTVNFDPILSSAVFKVKFNVKAGPAEVGARDTQMHARHYAPAGYELPGGAPR